MKKRTLAFPLVASAIFSSPAAGEEKKNEERVTYDQHVKPLLMQKCATCHRPDKKSGGLDLTNYTNLMQGGASGAVIEPGDVDSSYLYLLISHQEQPAMPPESDKLPEESLALVRKWIEGGAAENSGSKVVIKKPKMALALADTPSGRPANPVMPLRMTLSPVLRTEAPGAVTALATSPWAPLAAVAGQKQIFLYDTRSAELLGVLPFPEGTPYVLKFSRTGNLLLAGGGRGGASGKVVVWNVETAERVIEVGDELDAVLAADISADQSRIALGGPHKVVRIYSTADGSLLQELKKHTNWITSVEFSPDGVLLATADRAGGLLVWEAHTGREYLVLNGHTADVTSVSWRSDSNILASGSEDTTVRLWEMENGGEVKKWGAHGGGVQSVEFARDGRVLTCGRDRVAKLWDQAGAQQQAFEAFGDIALRVTFCDETDRAIAGDWTGAVRVWNAKDGARIGDLAVNPPTLEQRLTAAQQGLTAAQQKHTPLAAASTAAAAAATAAQQAVATAKEQLAAATAANLEATKSAATEKATMDAAAAEQKTAAGAVEKLTPAVPMISEAVAKAQAAAAKAGDDKELVDLAGKLAELGKKRQEELTSVQQTAEAKAKEAQAAEAKLAEMTKLAATTAATMKQLTDGMPGLEKAAQDTAAAAAAAAQAAQAAAGELAAADTAVKNWQAEIAFAKQLEELTAQLTAANQNLNAAAQAAADSQQQLVAMQAVAATAKAEADAATTGKAAAAAKLAAAVDASNKAQADSVQSEKDYQAAATAAATLKAALAPLSEAATKSSMAATMAAGDADLKTAAAMLQQVLEKKQAELTAADANVVALTAKVAAAKAAAEAAVKVVATETAAVQVADKLVADKMAAQRAADGKVAETQRLGQEAAAALAKMQQQADAVSAQILAARKTPRPAATAQASN